MRHHYYSDNERSKYRIAILVNKIKKEEIRAEYINRFMIDPNDVIAILSVPGELHRIEIPLAELVPPVEAQR